ncbi:MAG: deoxyribose-phosphate aldolase [Candidatus Omnitrophica bacterium]|nr:deoxyribose-phosphate aldolase [Candidatus Omnitrophota bacterium]
MVITELASKIEHTNLKPDATIDDIIKLCNEAKQSGFFGVCINSQYIKIAKEQLRGSKCKIITVVGFPLGACISNMKAEETGQAIDMGADEVDMVISIGLLKSKKYDDVKNDIKGVVVAAKGHPVKVIIETALLNETEKRKACELAKIAGATFVKTSTGFSKSGATVEDVKLMREIVGANMGIKAAGGIRDFDTARVMIEAGADRLGCSSSVKIVAKEEV